MLTANPAHVVGGGCAVRDRRWGAVQRAGDHQLDALSWAVVLSASLREPLCVDQPPEGVQFPAKSGPEMETALSVHLGRSSRGA